MRASYGDVSTEYRTLIESAAQVEALHDVVWVEGPDAVSFLDGILSQGVEPMATGSVARSLLLSPQGKLEALLWLLRGEERVGVVTDAGHGERVADKLGYYRIRVKAEIRLDDRPRFEVWGHQAREAAGLDAEGWTETDGVLRAALPLAGTGRVLVAGDLDLELPRAGELAATAVRVEAGEPVTGRDVTEDTIPHATGLVPRSVSFAKGCFLGYELVERMESRGANPPQRLLGLAVTRNVLPPEGSDVVSDGKPVGTITSVTESLRVGAPIGLGLLKRSVDPGDEVSIRWEGGETPAVVRTLPFLSEH